MSTAHPMLTMQLLCSSCSLAPLHHIPGTSTQRHSVAQLHTWAQTALPGTSSTLTVMTCLCLTCSIQRTWYSSSWRQARTLRPPIASTWMAAASRRSACATRGPGQRRRSRGHTPPSWRRTCRCLRLIHVSNGSTCSGPQTQHWYLHCQPEGVETHPCSSAGRGRLQMTCRGLTSPACGLTHVPRKLLAI